MYERIDPFNSKIIIKKKEKYANAKWILAGAHQLLILSKSFLLVL